MEPSLNTLLDSARSRRDPLLAELAREGTDSYRLFHGVAEGLPGLTVDRYGPLILAQTFREPLVEEEVRALQERYGPRFVYNHRGPKRTRFSYHRPAPEALEPVVARELGLNYSIKGRHRGLDSHLFLDMRVARRWLMGGCENRSVLNFFAYSCAFGLVAAAGGASEVWNVDFSESALRVGARNLELNGFEHGAARFVQEDFFPVAWQLSGLGVKGKRARRRFQRFSERTFDIVLLDPPKRAKGPFHTVDLVDDYQSLFKPALLCCSEGGQILAANNVGKVGHEEFESILRRCAEKAGRPLRSLDWLTPDDDFPSFDGYHPLKLVVCSV